MYNFQVISADRQTKPIIIYNVVQNHDALCNSYIMLYSKITVTFCLICLLSELLWNSGTNYKSPFYLAGAAAIMSSLIMVYPWWEIRQGTIKDK